GVFPLRGVIGPVVGAVLGAEPLGKQGALAPCGAGPLAGARAKSGARLRMPTLSASLRLPS
ncbi:MAG: hypothetical protein ACE1ZJ_03305, partial [Nitrospirales bacterium]